MTGPDARSGSAARVRSAAAEVERSKRRLASTIGALQFRLKPANLMNEAWGEIRDKGSEVAETTLNAVRKRPAAASGILAGIALFLAREPIRKGLSSLLSRNERDEEEATITADLVPEENYDLAAPEVPRSASKGVNA